MCDIVLRAIIAAEAPTARQTQGKQTHTTYHTPTRDTEPLLGKDSPRNHNDTYRVSQQNHFILETLETQLTPNNHL